MNKVKKLLPIQSQMLQAPYSFPDIRFFFCVAGYGSGKTSGLAYAILHTTKMLMGKKDFEGHMPKIMIASKNLTFLKKTLTGLLEQDLKDTNSEYKWDKASNLVTIGGAVQWQLIPAEDEGAIYGFSVACCFLDELDELSTHTAMAVVKACNERTRQQVEGMRPPFLMFCTSSQGLKGTYQTVMHFKKSGVGYVLMKGRTRDNVYLEKDYVDNMYKIYNENEVKCFLEGEFISVESSLVFPDYNPDKNKLDVDLWDDVAEDDTVYIGQDFNVGNNHAIAFVVKEFSNGESCIVAVKDYCFPDIRRAPEVFRYDFPKSKIVWIPDMTYKEHFSEFKKELRAFNITIAYRKTNPLVNDRVFACNKLFFSEHLFICPICKDLELALLSHQRDKRTGLPMKGAEKSPDHKSDCLGYAVHYLLSWHRGLKNLYDVTLRYLYSKRDARGSEAFLAEEGQVISASEIRRKVEFARNVDKV